MSRAALLSKTSARNSISRCRMDPDTVYVGPDPQTDELWAGLFKHHNVFKAAREKAIYFTILAGGSDYYALIVTNRGDSCMSQGFWSLFLASLKGPYQIDEAKGEILFPEQGLRLNVHNFLHTSAFRDVVIEPDPDRLVRQHYMSGVSLTWSVGISTYGDAVDACHQIADAFKGSAERHSGFRLVFLVANEARQIDILPSITHTWPS